MITPEDVKYQLMGSLPQYTDEFGTVISGMAVVDSGVVKVTSTAHGLATGDVIVTSSVLMELTITNVSYDSVAGEATLTTEIHHDRTSEYTGEGDYGKADLRNFADSNYNGSDFAIKRATRDTFVIDADADVIGALGVLVEPRSAYLGYNQVTVIDANTFTLPLQGASLIDGIVFDTFNYTSKQRILIAADKNRAIAEFAKRANREPSLFIIFTDERASRDRHTVNDAVTTVNSQNSARLTYIPTVELISMVNVRKEPLAETQHQKTYAEIRPALRKAMYGHLFSVDEGVTAFGAIEAQNFPSFHNIGDYIHSFVYEIPYVITIEQGDTYRHNVSFRDIVVNSTLFDSEGALSSFNAELEI